MKVFASFDGVRIAYHDEGEGPAVVLLHGYGFDGLSNFGDFDRSLPTFERTSELCRAEFGVALSQPAPLGEGRAGLIPVLLAAGARVIVPDMRGFGASDKPRDEAAYANSAMARQMDSNPGPWFSRRCPVINTTGQSSHCTAICRPSPTTCRGVQCWH